jgi:hypothetical protein
MRIVEPKRVKRTYVQQLNAEPGRVFPLLCPVREADWIAEWDPVLVVTASGVAEADCTFVTPAQPHNAIWYITRHDQEHLFVEMLKISPEFTACRVTIQMRSTANGSEAEVTYMHTSLGPAGDSFVESFTEEYYREFMRAWEARMNYYLEHGRALESPA